MAVNKKYSAISRRNYLLSIDLPGRDGQINVDFKSGYGRNGDAFLFTDDPALQKALESDKRFNKTFRLESIDGMLIEEYEARKLIGQNVTAVNNSPKLELKEFDDINGAKDFLKSEPNNVEGKKIPNLAAVQNRGRELGYDIVIKNQNS